MEINIADEFILSNLLLRINCSNCKHNLPSLGNMCSSPKSGASLQKITKPDRFLCSEWKEKK